MSPPTISTARLELVPLNDSAEHKQLLLELDTDAEVMRYIEFGRPFDTAEAEMTRQALLGTAATPGFGTWVAQTKQEPRQLVGWWVLAPSETDATKTRAEFGMRVVRASWGKGYAKEGTLALLKYAFEAEVLKAGGLDVVYGETMVVNTGSRRTMESCGMGLVRTYFNEYKDFTLAPGIEEGEVEYAVTRAEWQGRAGAAAASS